MRARVCLYNQELGFVFIIFEMPVRPPEGTQRTQVNVLSLGIPVYGRNLRPRAWMRAEVCACFAHAVSPRPMPGTQQVPNKHLLNRGSAGSEKWALPLPSPAPQGGDPRQQCGGAAAPGVHGYEVPGGEELCAP